jgi:TPR repeat protein
MRALIFLGLVSIGCGASTAAPASRTQLVAPDKLGEAEYADAASRYQRACDAGSPQGCGYLGFMYDNGYGVPQDVGLAVTLTERACDEGDAYGCAYLGYLHQVGRGVAHDAGRAAALFRKACDGEDRSGCLLLGIMYKTGSGVPEDPE